MGEYGDFLSETRCTVIGSQAYGGRPGVECGDLNENAPMVFIKSRNTWIPVGGTVWEALGCIALLYENVYRQGLIEALPGAWKRVTQAKEVS